MKLEECALLVSEEQMHSFPLTHLAQTFQNKSNKHTLRDLRVFRV